MTPAELAMPWRTFDVQLVPWSIVVRRGAQEATLSADEVLDAIAALELDRAPQRIMQVAVAQRAQGRRAALPWGDLVDGARGLTSRAQAPGELAFGAGLDALGLELVRVA